MTVPWSDEACSLLTTNSSSKVLSHKVEVQNAANNRSNLHVHTKNLSRKPGNVRILCLYKRAQDTIMYFYTRFYIFVSSFSFWMSPECCSRHFTFMAPPRHTWSIKHFDNKIKDRESQRAFQTLNWHCIFTYELTHSSDNSKEIKLFQKFVFWHRI